ncbi:hypothetical protein CEW91_09895 [Idiomarina piscisalsi]|uniref:Polysaccharide biosynthesis protein C-terminal domain-containing protein n=1 Tax=Idiomarina piscisalsi TaxID=1096243 RepID=A0ABM6LUZ1_9GAMM|nr:polysaccharide biosynthesis C-terminal domain-containing protein [Idiomarina piscisalsi]ASG66428.1 hypothetical protein CEW91_09895 [Idiomarina piscisalsi]
MSLLKRFSGDILLYGAGVAVTKSLTIVMLPLLTSYLTVEQVGMVELGLALSTVLLLFILLGVDTGLTFFYWDEKSTIGKSSYITSSFLIIIIAAALISILLIYLKKPLESLYFKSETTSFFYMLIVSLVAQAFFNMSNKVLRIKRLVKQYNVIIIVNSALFLVLLFFVLKKEQSVESFFIAKSISYVVAFLLSIYLIRASLISFPDLNRAKQLISYSLPLLPFAATSAVMTVLDKFFVNYFLDISDVGVYSVGAKVGGAVILLIAAFSMSFGPFAMSIKERKEAKGIYARIFLIYLSIMLGSVLGLATVDDWLLGVLTRNQDSYSNSITVITPIALGLVIHSFFSQLGIGLNITKNNHFFFYGSIVSLGINIVLSPFFITSFGVIGAAYSTLISYLIVTFWIYFISRKKYPIPYSLSKILLVSLIFIICYSIMVSNFLYHTSFIKDLIVVLIYFSAISPILYSVFKNEKSN